MKKFKQHDKFVLIQNIFDLLALISMVILFFHFAPSDLFNTLPATGGDTGSHFWPVYTLHHYGIPNLDFRLWNPGNIGGEPQLIHYFPLPFILMALLGFIMDLGLAFNLGTALGTFALPFVVYASIRIIGHKFPAPIITAFFTIPFIYSETYSIFGGNFLSTMSGQFAHAYAICFLILAVAFIIRAIKKNRVSAAGIILLSMTALSHAYIFLIAPFFFLSILVLARKEERFKWLKIFFVTGVMTLLITCWLIWPMIDHQPWMTPNPMVFGVDGFKDVFVSRMLYPAGIFMFLATIVLLFRKQGQIFRDVLVWVIPAITYVGLFFLLPKFGLVDARALPQTLLFSLIAAGMLTACCIKSTKYRIIPFIMVPIISASLVTWTILHVKALPHWMKWNYSGWQDKKHYVFVRSISEALEPGFDKPRVIYEHHPELNQAGTTRVFEMLPYFAKRATMEGLYLQSSLLSPASLYLQSQISTNPSCAVKQFKCTNLSFDTLKNKMDLNAVSSIIVITKKVKDSANNYKDLVLHSAHGPYSIYTLKYEPKYATPLTGNASLMEYKNEWRFEAHDWFMNYDGENNWKIVDLPGLNNSEFIEAILSNKVSDCNTKVEVDFNGFEFSTSCPGVPHILKFAYQDSFKNSSDLPMYLVAPGMIGFIPNEEKTIFEFGQKLSWKVADYVSLLSFILIFFVRQKFRP